MASPYQVHVPDADLQNLKQKLELATFPDELEDSDWDYGAPLSDVKRLTEYWRDTFDWRAQEAKLNELPSFHRPIAIKGFGELDIHYLHQKSGAPNAIPLLFVHGWPGNYLEVSKMLPLLKDEANGVAFDVVAPSLPNYGWSEGTKKKGFGLRQYAECFDRLMRDLGYERYVTQGGDWGMMITRTMGLLFPERVLASHINMVRGAVSDSLARLEMNQTRRTDEWDSRQNSPRNPSSQPNTPSPPSRQPTTQASPAPPGSSSKAPATARNKPPNRRPSATA